MEIVKGLKSTYDVNTITQAKTEILERLFTIQVGALDLQERHSALINEKEELVKKLVQFEQWEKTESEYELQEINTGKLVYSPKNSQQSKIPTHWLCTQCWEERKKSILQAVYHSKSDAQYICPKCKLMITFYFSDKSS